jgi:cell division protein ZapE
LAKTVRARLAEEVAAHRLQFDPAQAAAAARLDALSEELHRHRPGLHRSLLARLPWPAVRAAPRGLYLWGGVGRGKTLLMDLFVATLPPQRVERRHFYRFMRAVHAGLAGAKGRTQPLEAVARAIAARTQVVCLDEFFVADIADAMILAGLLDGLFRRGVTLVTTSNLAPRELYRDGLQRQRFAPAIELIETHTEVLHLDGGVDYRLLKLERTPTYFDAARPDTAAALAALFAELAGGEGHGPVTLSIEERPLEARATGPGLVWFEFDELCAGPRSQNDYIELARRFGTIFIANVPQMPGQLDDAARRFIMLIDELYDRGVKIVVSAAAGPAELYQGERLRHDFERAASRLVEMQTKGYLARPHHV